MLPDLSRANVFMKNQVGIGIIGMGAIASYHVKSILEIADARLAAVTSSNAHERKKAEDLGAKSFSDYHEMLLHRGLDIVIICTPSGFHLDPAIAAARAGKHVIVEKPLEITVQRARQLIVACEEAQVKLACIFQNRYSEDFARVYRAAQEGSLGKLILGNAYVKWFRSQEYYDAAAWRGTKNGDGGAVLINQSIHTIDLLLQVMGPVKSVFGQVKTLTHDIEGEDLGVGFIEFENGALGTIEGSTSIFEGFPEKLEIHGEDGSMILEGGKLVLQNTRGGEKTIAQEKNSASGSSNPMAIDYMLHKKQLEDIIRAIRNDEAPVVSGEDAIKSIRVIEAIYQSASSGRKIVF